jgi:hypothetical protein
VDQNTLIAKSFLRKGVLWNGLMDTQCEVWRPLADRNWLDHEVTAAKEALRAASKHKLEKLPCWQKFKIQRKGTNKKSKEIEDIRMAIVDIQDSGSIPLVLATSGMMGRCPPSWGQPANPTSQDVMGKVHMLEEVLSSHMEQQKKQMEKLGQEMAGMRASGPKAPTFNGLSVDQGCM